MSKTDSNIQAQIPKFSKYAIASFVLAVIAFVITFDFFFFMTIHLPSFPLLNIAIAGISLILSAIFGIRVESEIKKSQVKLRGTLLGIIGMVISLFVILSVFTVVVFNKQIKNFVYKGRIESVYTARNFRYLYDKLQIYAQDFDGNYPEPDKWCDLLIEYARADKPAFTTSMYGEPNNYYTYAINPDCSPSSPNDIVLLFETKEGWNQLGGPELISTEHYKIKGCNILFNNGHVEFVKKKELGKLKWKSE